MQTESRREDWSAVAARRREQILGTIPAEWIINADKHSTTPPIDVPHVCGVLTSDELEITELRACDLVSAMRDQKYSAISVTVAFCKRAAVAHQLTNCLAEVLFEQALRRARELDAYMIEHGRPVGPLHGLPISVKEHVHVKGTRTTSGLIAWADRISNEDALIARQLRDAGAVFHVKTTNPQTLMSLETTSNLFGRTLNPYNTNLTSGGSSGGEAVLIAMRGSPMGIGTDIGGSIRVPSAFCGIYGLKPSVGRTPHSGLSGLHDGMQTVIGVVGPMVHSLEDANLFMQLALSNEPFLKEPAMIEKPWQGLDTTSTIRRVGVMWNDGMVHPHPPVMQALAKTMEALQQLGVEVVKWEPDFLDLILDLANQAYFQDGGEEYRAAVREGEEPLVPLLARSLAACGPHITAAQSWKINAEIDRVRTLYARKWNDERIDCVICPVSPSVASVHNETLHWGYSCVWNVLDYPAVVLPVGKVTDSMIVGVERENEVASLGSLDDWYTDIYNPQKYAGAPLAVQVVGRRLQEERLLDMAVIIDKAIIPFRESPTDMDQVVLEQRFATAHAEPASGERLQSVL